MNRNALADLVRLAGDVWLLGPELGDPAAAARWEDALAIAVDRALGGDTVGARRGFVAAMRGAVVPVVAQESMGAADTGTQRFAPGGIPVVPIPSLLDRAAEGRLAEALASGDVILDLRRGERRADPSGRAWPAILAACRPPERFRVHTGWRSEGRADTGGFGSSWQVLDAVGPLPSGRVAFVVDPGGALPPAALAWAMVGRATWVVEGAGEPIGPVGSLLPRGDCAVVTGEFPAAGPAPLRVPSGSDPIVLAANWVRSGDRGGAPKPGFIDRAAGIPPATHRDGRVSALRALVVLARFHPYRKETVESALAIHIPECWKPSEAARVAALRRALAALGDGHARVRTPDPSDPLAGIPPPVRLRWTGRSPVVARLLHPSARAYGAREGDTVETIDGEPVARRARRLAELLPAGTSAARRLYVANRLLCGPPGVDVHVGLASPGGRVRVVQLPRDPSVFAAGDPPERDTPAAGWLRPGIGYIDLDRMRPADLEAVLRRFRGAREWVVDLRGRANECGWELARFLAPPAGISAARFILDAVGAPQPAAGGVMTRVVDPRIEPGPWRFRGGVTVRVDERTQSQSELAALILRVCGARLVGTNTAGAIGDVTEVSLPSGGLLSFSGQRIQGIDGTRIHEHGLPALPDTTARRSGPAATRRSL